jgi:hypothetical protein
MNINFKKRLEGTKEQQRSMLISLLAQRILSQQRAKVLAQ